MLTAKVGHFYRVHDQRAQA